MVLDPKQGNQLQAMAAPHPRPFLTYTAQMLCKLQLRIHGLLYNLSVQLTVHLQ